MSRNAQDLHDLTCFLVASLGTFEGEVVIIDGRAFRLRDGTPEPFFSPARSGALGATATLPEGGMLAVQDKTLLSLSGSELQPIAELAPWGSRFVAYAMAASGERDVWISARTDDEEDGRLYHWDGSSLEAIELPGDVEWMGPTPALDADGELWVAGLERPAEETEERTGRALVFHRTMDGFQDESPELDNAYSVDIAIADGQVWLVGADGQVAVRDSGSWSRHDITEGPSKVEFAVLGPDDVYATAPARRADGGMLQHFDGREWRFVDALRDSPLHRFASAGRHLWATGWPREGEKVVVHFDGSTWDTIDSDVFEEALRCDTCEVPVPTALTDGRVVFSNSRGNWLLSCHDGE